MQFLYLLKVEAKRIFCSKITYLFIALCSIAPLFGYVFDSIPYTMTKAVMYIGNPLLVGALIGAVLFAMFTLYELSKVDKNEISALTDTMISPLTMGICKTFALIFVAIITTIIIMLTQLPYIVVKSEELFRLNDFLTLSIWGLFTNLCFGVIVSSAFYHFFKRVDLSFISFILLLIFSHSEFIENNFMLRWANPWIRVLSDAYGNYHILRLVIYSKIFWMLIFGGMWVLSVLCIRKYGKGLFKSVFRNSRKNILAIVLSIVMIGSGVAMYVYQPFLDHSPGLGWGDAGSQTDDYEQNMNVVRYSQSIDVRFDTKAGTLFSKITYNIGNITNEEQTVLLFINPGFKIESVSLNNIDVVYTDLNNDKGGFKAIEIKIPKEQKGDLVIHYGGYRQEKNYAKTIYGWYYICDEYIRLTDDDLVSWLFIDTDWDNWKTDSRTLTMTLPEHMTLVTNWYAPEVISENSDGTKTWNVSNSTAYAADFAVHTFEYDEMDLEFYYSSKYEDMIKNSGTIELIDDVLNYCINAFGTLPLLDEDIPFRLIQATEHVLGGGAFRGYSFLSESNYVAENLTDPLKGANAAEIIVHELLHQWWGVIYHFTAGQWGRGVPDGSDEEEWGSEGMTVYTSYRIMKQLKGEEYAQKYYVDVWEKENANLQRAFYYQNPQYLDILPAKYRWRILREIETIEQYAVMPLKLLKAEQLLGSEQAFDKAVMDGFASALETHEPVSYDQFLTALGLTRGDLSLD